MVIEFMKDLVATGFLTFVFFLCLAGISLIVVFMVWCYRELTKPEDTSGLADNPDNYKD